MSTEQTVIYLAEPNTDKSVATTLATQLGATEALAIGRRGYHVGWIAKSPATTTTLSPAQIKQQWQTMGAIVLDGYFKADLDHYKHNIDEAQALYEAILDDACSDDLLSEEPYASRLTPKFELLGASCNEADPQEIETLDFDVMDGDEIIAEELWVKLSWLSFLEEDTSLRLRFSFGMVGYEDVAADYQRQCFAAELTEAVFPHSAIISQSPKLQALLSDVLEVGHVDYVERIVYFNAPNGGAQFHQDVERGHRGVVFAQMSGRTAWLALSKEQLINEIISYMSTDHAKENYLTTIAEDKDWKTLLELSKDKEKLSIFLDEYDNEPTEYLVNRVPAFTQQLINNGYGFILNPGDVILLPQQDIDNCCWHSVFCLDDYAGQALSFAIRATPV